MEMRSENGKQPTPPKGCEDYDYYKMVMHIDKPSKGEGSRHKVFLQIEVIPKDVYVQQAYIVRYIVLTKHIFNSHATVISCEHDNDFLVMTQEAQFICGEKTVHVYAKVGGDCEIQDVKAVFS